MGMPIQPEVQSRTTELRREFETSRPFRHAVADNFLDPRLCSELMAEFPAFDPSKARNELGKVGRKAVFANLPRLGAAYARFDRMVRSREFLSWLGGVTGIPRLLYDPDYVGGGTHENLDGQELDNHVDFNYHPTSRLHRRLNLILFLNPEWRPEWGGCLELHRNPWVPEQDTEVCSVVPLANRAVLFETTERSWHGFRKIAFPPEKAHLSRRSIAVYFYTRKRPPLETAPSHSTVYIQRGLPGHLKPGHVLEEGDIKAIQILLARRDQQIQMLYKREKGFSATISATVESRAFWLVRKVTWPWRMGWRIWHFVRHGE